MRLNCTGALAIDEVNTDRKTMSTPTETAAAAAAAAGSGGQITRNESFFSDSCNFRNASMNPLLLTSLNKLNKLEMSLDRLTNEEAKITVSDAALYANNFNIDKSVDSGSSSMSRDGFVTNKRYQNLKDNKHSACVLSTCYDEVFQANGGDSDSVSSGDDDELKPEHALDSVVINMYNDSDETCSLTSKQKFEQNLANYSQKQQRMQMNETELSEIIESDVKPGENKYVKDEELLKKYENECRFGARPRAYLLDEGDLGKHDEDADQDTINTIDYFKFKSNFIARTQLNSQNRASQSNMKNDFSKNEDEDECDEEEETERLLPLKVKPSGSAIQMKTLLNNKKPPPPPSTSAHLTTGPSHLLSSGGGSSESKCLPKQDNFLLDNLLTHLKTKNTNKSIQFNNYKTDVDGCSNFGLGPLPGCNERVDDSLIAALNARQTNLSSLELAASANSVLLNEKSNSSSSSSSTSSKSESNYMNNNMNNANSLNSNHSNKPGAINRRSAEAYMDSHGSSLTNSSKQEDEDDYEEENPMHTNQNHMHAKHLNEEHDFEELSDTELTAKHKGSQYDHGYSYQVKNIKHNLFQVHNFFISKEQRLKSND